MPEDHIEARMNFIIEQQARFAVDIQLLQESMRELGQKQSQTDDRLRGLVDVSMSLANHIEGLTNHIEEVDQRLTRFAEGMLELRDSQRHTDQKLDTLADIVRQHIESHHGNGGRLAGE
jgi:soluble cytochrome b562